MKLSWFLPCVALAAVGCGGGGKLSSATLDIMVEPQPVGEFNSSFWTPTRASVSNATAEGAYRHCNIHFDAPLVGESGTVGLIPEINSLRSQYESTPGDNGEHMNVYALLSAAIDYRVGADGLLRLRVRDIVAQQKWPTDRPATIPDFSMTCAPSVGMHNYHIDAADLKVSGTTRSAGSAQAIPPNVVVGPDSGADLRTGARTEVLTLDFRKPDNKGERLLLLHLPIFTGSALPQTNTSFRNLSWVNVNGPGHPFFWEQYRGVTTVNPDGRVFFRGVELQSGQYIVRLDGEVKIGNRNRILYNPFESNP